MLLLGESYSRWEWILIPSMMMKIQQQRTRCKFFFSTHKKSRELNLNCDLSTWLAPTLLFHPPQQHLDQQIHLEDVDNVHRAIAESLCCRSCSGRLLSEPTLDRIWWQDPLHHPVWTMRFSDPPPAIISTLRMRDRISNEASPPKPHVQKRYSTYLMTLNGDGYYDIHIYCIDNQNMEIS